MSRTTSAPDVPGGAMATAGMATRGAASSAGAASRLVRASLSRARVELLQFFRSRDAVGFTLALPVVMLILLASIFTDRVRGTSVAYSQIYTTGLLAGGVASTCFLNLAVVVAGERENGTLKRLAGTPMPRTAYFMGKALMVLTTCALETAVLLLFGHFVYNVQFPATPWRWFTFVWVTVLGAVSMALVGLAFSSLPRSARSAAPVANLPLLVLEFLSGVFVPFTSLSKTIYDVAGIFPLRWIAQGYRSALLPQYFVRIEPTRGWDHAQTALVLAAWCAVGLAVAARTFRWTGKGER